MYIYVKTPLVGSSNSIPHLLEHCLLNKKDLTLEEFFLYCDVQVNTSFGYTRYDINTSISVDSFIKKICAPFDIQIFEQELSALKQEIQDKTFFDSFKNHVEKLLYITVSSFVSPCLEDVLAYHKKRYKKNTIVVCDDHYTLLQHTMSIDVPADWSFIIEKQKTVSITGEKNKITILPYTHRKSYTFLYFVEFLYDTYMEYSQRHRNGRYFFPTASVLLLSEYVCIAIPQSIPLDISSKFLDTAKKHFCEVALDEYARKIEIENLLCIGQLPSDDDIKKFIQSLDLSIVKKVF